MVPVGFEPTTPASEGPQTHVLYRAGVQNGSCVVKEKVLKMKNIRG
jgi:hypothetical protein